MSCTGFARFSWSTISQTSLNRRFFEKWLTDPVVEMGWTPAGGWTRERITELHRDLEGGERMNIAHKENEKIFLLAEMRQASAFNVVDDGTGAVLGTAVAVMEANPDSWPAYLTEDDGTSFYPSIWEFREFPHPPTLIQLVDRTTVETDPVRVADLRLALEKWRDIVSSD